MHFETGATCGYVPETAHIEMCALLVRTDLL